ncbi:uncharacterized protein LOC117325313 isoform X2 [Pecten maximus]|uniref:uncharacterized protein LOC117325313 isoform X2 n=1 Tax=Pecten maximus TaxID=6579 RepID=UPI0014580B25|nr:uncharacterized protein LOC117325313 isoform X2 [Pecten maximus]
MKTICLLLISLGHLMWFSSACQLCCNCGSFLPNDPFYYTNETSILTCALNKPSKLINASDLYITFNGTEVDQSFMTIVNETAVAFTKVVRKLEDDGKYQCRIRQVTGNEGLIGTVTLKVDDPLEPINDIECIWHNWKDKLVCTWILPPYRYMQYIKVDLSWYNGATNKCPNMENKTVCTWSKSDASLDTITWAFILTVRNTQHGNDTRQGSWIQKIVKDNVKPSAVKSFNQTFTNESTCLLLTWVYDTNIAPSREKHFRIQYSPVTDPSHNNTVWSDGDHVTVCQLTPYTLYEFTIAVHPDRAAVKGYWSDSVTHQFRTDQDVPRAAPEMVGYRHLTEPGINKQGTHAEIISTVFWKLIPKEDRNGLITRYSVNITDLSPGGVTTEKILLNTQNSNTNLNLHCNKLYNVSITAATIKGYSPVHSSLIINTTGFSQPVLMVERNASIYNISWTVPWPADSLTSFNVVYCKQLGSQQDCSSELEKAIVPDPRTHHQTLSLKSDTTYLFGVSLIRAGVASAATFESCVYVVTAAPNPPEFSVDDSIGDNSLRISWDSIACNNQQPYVRSFTVIWCPINKQQENRCIGPKHSVVIPSTSKTEYIIKNLEKDVRFGVTMSSSSSSQTSRLSDMKYGTPTNNALTTGQIAGIVAAALFVTILVIAGVIFACRIAKSEMMKIRTPYVIDVPELEKDSSPNGSTGSSRCTNNSQQPLLPNHRELNGHAIHGQDNAVISKSDQTKRQISHDSGKGGSLSSEPDMPDRLLPVPEDDTKSYTREQSDGKIRSTSGSSVNNTYSVLHTTNPDGQTSVEPVSDPHGEVQVNPTEITAMFVGVSTTYRDSTGVEDGYKSPDQIMCDSGEDESTIEDSPTVTKDIDHMISSCSNAVQSGITHIPSTENGTMSQESTTTEGNSSSPLRYTMMDTSASLVDPVRQNRQLAIDTAVAMCPEEEQDSVSDGYTSQNNGYTSQDNIGMLAQDNTQEQHLSSSLSIEVPLSGTCNTLQTTVS